MERRGRIAVAFVLMAFAMIFLTGCTTEKHTEAAKETQQQTEHDAEKSGYEVSGDSPGQEPQQNPKDKDEAEETNQEITEENLYRPLMEAAIEAIEANDAEALHELQDSEDAKILTASVRDGEHYIYYPDGGQSGKGVGFYTFKDTHGDEGFLEIEN